MNPIFLGQRAFFRAFGHGFYLGGPRSYSSRRRSEHQRSVRSLKRRAKRFEWQLKPFMRAIVSDKGLDHPAAKAWLANKASR